MGAGTVGQIVVTRARIVAALVWVSLVVTTGCEYRSARRTAILGGVLVVPGAVAVEIIHGHDSNPLTHGGFEPVPLAATYLLVAGVVLLTVGLTGLALFDKPLTADEQKAADEQAERSQAARAEALSREELAARHPDCLRQRVERLRIAGRIADGAVRARTLLDIRVCAAPDAARDAQLVREQAAREQAARDAATARDVRATGDAQAAAAAQAAREAEAARKQQLRAPCLKERAERLRDAGEITDAALRAAALASVPACPAAPSGDRNHP